MLASGRVGVVLLVLVVTQICTGLLPVGAFAQNEVDIGRNTSSFDHVNIMDRASIRYPFGEECLVDESESGMICVGLSPHHQPFQQPLPTIRFLELLNCSVHTAMLRHIFPLVTTLVLTRSVQKDGYFSGGGVFGNNATTVEAGIPPWISVLSLNISRNDLDASTVAIILPLFPSIELLDLSHNRVNQVELDLDKFRDLRLIDISGNPLNCTAPMEFLDRVTLLHAERTLCDQPPHVNRAKPIWKVRKLIKKVRDECNGNCSCDIAYIWELNHEIHSKITVNCSGRGFMDFPDPTTLPNPTDTLDLSNNEITSMRRFVEDDRYEKLDVMNLHLDSNRLESIALLETSDWFYNFQIFTFRNNSISEVPVYVLENVFAHNKRILQVDLSLNPFHCDCTTLSTLKIWLLKHTSNIKHIEDVRCSQGGSQIRYLRHEDWCTVEAGQAGVIDIFDIISFFLALAIFAVVAKVYYDYWNLKRTGKLPWVATKM